MSNYISASSINITGTGACNQSRNQDLDIQQRRALALRAKQGDIEARDALAEYHLQHLEPIAKQMKRRYNTTITVQELCSDGYLKLLTMWRGYDPKKTSDPTAFVKTCVRNAMMDSLRSEFKSGTTLMGDSAERVSDPYGEDNFQDDDKDKNKPPLDASVISKLEQIKQAIGRSRNGQQIFELSHGVDLGTNPDLEELSSVEIGKRLGLASSSVRSGKLRIMRKVDELKLSL